MMKEILDVPYSAQVRDAQSDKRLLDVLLPAVSNGGCLFFVHGGGWSGGCKEQWRSVMQHFCGLGYVCVSAGYRLTPQHRFPAPFSDVRLAFAYVKSHADEWGFDPERIAAWGSSAGGHLVAMLATTDAQDDLGATSVMPLRDTRPAAVVALCAVYSVVEDGRLKKTIHDFLGGSPQEKPELARQASPIEHVNSATPPFLIVQGDADETTPLADQEAMTAVLRHHGVPVEIVVLPGVDHGFGYGVTSEAQIATLACSERFLQEYL